uniref:Serine/threonine-protein kinase RIO1 n=1 Tax=Chromera velia CCMP2878 TaxID=1169474 RepID=A0A0G4I0X8_9ALVE|eukprot:Cvel_10055.t1-p1 / transcript=Cvel_10055.t1 / gene=Cvel_10055 / organism=Chromera_velia_CCMP2878 / gene_product=Serine/threonine-protein kinase rio1, putative / transcript_product=Serine/threonine-protein kinase rio1, putative / location=Cvel_scaffold598:43257-47505(+) / protein_length=811 / sequence_SO=supercontig / SO=protein_coding / is_pseudo=false
MYDPQRRGPPLEIDSEDDLFDGSAPKIPGVNAPQVHIPGRTVFGADDSYESDGGSEDFSEDELVKGESQARGPNRQHVDLGRKMMGAASKETTGKVMSRINTSALPTSVEVAGSTLQHAAKNSIVAGQKKADIHRNRGLTRDTRATVEQVLDPRTCLLLAKLMRRGVFTEIYGCLSTGKEANVYYAVNGREWSSSREGEGDRREGGELAVKVFKTSILVFKDRAKYVEGEFRFRHGYGGRNPRKMVAQWAEKEFRNLKRIAHSGIRAPLPLELRGHVIAIRFVGSEGHAAARLKDSKLTQAEWRRAYVETVAIMRLLYQECKLVHGDLSEYNLLWQSGHVFVIDVSQSTENDHPLSMDFLKRDCVNVTAFFRKEIKTTKTEKETGDTSAWNGACLPVRVLFDLVVAPKLPPVVQEGLEAALSKQTDEGVEVWPRKDERYQASNIPLDSCFLDPTAGPVPQLGKRPQPQQQQQSEAKQQQQGEEEKQGDEGGQQEQKNEEKEKENVASQATASVVGKGRDAAVTAAALSEGRAAFDRLCAALLFLMEETSKARAAREEAHAEMEEQKQQEEWSKQFKETVGEGEKEGESQLQMERGEGQKRAGGITAVDLLNRLRAEGKAGGGVHTKARQAKLAAAGLAEQSGTTPAASVPPVPKADEVSASEGSDEEDLDELEERVFLSTWIPSHLNQVYDQETLERELDKEKEGGHSHLSYLVGGVNEEGEKGAGTKEEKEGSEGEGEGEEGDVESGEANEEDEDEEDEDDESRHDGHIPEGMTAKEWKKKVKEENRERRRNKLPKHVKKKYRKQASNRK